jgi:hypothetical protein
MGNASAKEARKVARGSVNKGVADVLCKAAATLEVEPVANTALRLAEDPSRDQVRAPGSATVFWDYENCCVPKGMRGYDVTRKIREFVAAKHLQLKGMNAIGNPA